MIVLNYNSLKKLGERVLYFNRSIAYTNYSNFEMIVVDNGSIDGSDKLIEDELGRVGRGRVVKVEKNLGFTRGNNLGFELGCRSAKYVAFLNNDIEVEPDWLDMPCGLIPMVRFSPLRLGLSFLRCYGAQ
jgi:GT2 family glycosyltransferase